MLKNTTQKNKDWHNIYTA